MKTNRVELTTTVDRRWLNMTSSICNWLSWANFTTASGRLLRFGTVIFLAYCLASCLGEHSILVDIDSPWSRRPLYLCSVGSKANGMTRMLIIPTCLLSNAHRKFSYCNPVRRRRYTHLSRPLLAFCVEGVGHETTTDGLPEWSWMRWQCFYFHSLFQH